MEFDVRAAACLKLRKLGAGPPMACFCNTGTPCFDIWQCLDTPPPPPHPPFPVQSAFPSEPCTVFFLMAVQAAVTACNVPGLRADQTRAAASPAAVEACPAGGEL